MPVCHASNIPIPAAPANLRHTCLWCSPPPSLLFPPLPSLIPFYPHRHPDLNLDLHPTPTRTRPTPTPNLHLHLHVVGCSSPFHATRPTTHGASRLVQAMFAWSVKTRRIPSRHCRHARVYGHTTTAMHDNEYPPFITSTPAPVPTSIPAPDP